MGRIPAVGQLYRHFKGNLYQIVGIATHTESEEKLVVYQALYGDYKIYARPLEMFLSTADGGKFRFELVNREELVSVQEITPTTESAPRETVTNPEEREEANPDILYFLDGESSREKIEILKSMKKRISEKLLEDMAVSLDFVLMDGTIEDKYEAILNCLETKARFETNRFR